MPTDQLHPDVDIFAFTDPRDYMRAVLLQWKQQRHDFRLGNFAVQAGFRSPSLLSMLINGKRKLSPLATEKLAKALALKGKRKNYFLAMGRSQYSRGSNEKLAAQEEMLKLKSSTEPTLLQLKQYRFFSIWYYPTIFVMAGLRNMRWDLKWISRRLGRGISADQVKTALSDLVELGLFSQEESIFKRLVRNPSSGEDFKNSAVIRYHQQMSTLAIQALDLPLPQREMNGLTVPIPSAQIPIIKERIRQFRKELNDYLAPFEEEADDVYQINFQLFRLTQDAKDEETGS